MSECTHALQAEWEKFVTGVRDCRSLENLIAARSNAMTRPTLKSNTKTIVDEMNATFLEHLANKPIETLSDERLCSLARYTDGTPLKDYENALDLVPDLVNLVSLADALPLDGSALPFDLRKIAAKCKGAVYFAPRRFTAVQLAFDEPRSRVLLFHTGRVVGTGCDSATAAKLAVARALKTIAQEGGVHVAIRRYAVINQVGAIALGARLDCNAFADTHSATAHYDPKSFVGLAWRPMKEAICSEIYATGKSNLPGSRRERQLLRSFARMAPELLRHSSEPALADRFCKKLRDAHLPQEHTRSAPRVERQQAKKQKQQAKRNNNQTCHGKKLTPSAAPAQTSSSTLWEDNDDDDDEDYSYGLDATADVFSTGPSSDFGTCGNRKRKADALPLEDADENMFGDIFDSF